MKMKNSRRAFIKKSAMVTLAGAGLHLAAKTAFAGGLLNHETETYTLPALPYPAEALEPHIDTLTMQIHHGKHHKAYVDNLNKALNEAHIADVKLEDLLYTASTRTPAIRNNAGGHYNHSLFWKLFESGWRW